MNFAEKSQYFKHGIPLKDMHALTREKIPN